MAAGSLLFRRDQFPPQLPGRGEEAGRNGIDGQHGGGEGAKGNAEQDQQLVHGGLKRRRATQEHRPLEVLTGDARKRNSRNRLLQINIKDNGRVFSTL